MQMTVKVTPGAKEDKIVSIEGNLIKLRVSAAPDKGKANLAVIDLLAKHYKVPKRCVIIKSGHTSKTKTVLIEGESCQ